VDFSTLPGTQRCSGKGVGAFCQAERRRFDPGFPLQSKRQTGPTYPRQTQTACGYGRLIALFVAVARRKPREGFAVSPPLSRTEGGRRQEREGIEKRNRAVIRRGEVLAVSLALWTLRERKIVR
jgi:hypothetical protein